MRRSLKNGLSLLLRSSLLALLTTGCGYHLGYGGVTSSYRTISIPYVEGDEQGRLTSALIRTVTQTGNLRFVTCRGDLELCVCLEAPEDDNIGFIYAPESNGSLSNIVVSNEARLSIDAKVSVIERRTGQRVLGPVTIPTDVTFDFESDLSNVNFHAFSLGQLEMFNLAKDAAFVPLYDRLAQKIVDYVNHCW